LVIGSLLAACGGGSKSPTASPGTNGVALSKAIKSKDGKLEMRIPSSWKQDPGLNESADLQASNRAEEGYVLVITDLKENFPKLTLQQFGQTALDNFLKGITSPAVTGPKKVTVSAGDAIRYELTGAANNVSVTYLFTMIETQDRFLQVIAWTLPDQLAKNRRTLEAITNSIAEA
jgi:hypothetical protein